MNKKLKGVIAAGSTFAVLAALAPLAAYADTPTPAESTTNVSVKVNPTITISATEQVTLDNVTPNELADEGSFTVTVNANKGYTLSLSADEPNLVSSESGNTNNIPAIPNGGTSALPAGTAAWGVKKVTSAGNDSDETPYTGLTTEGDVFYESSTGSNGDTITFPLGIMVTPNIPSGTYSTSVTITASTV